MKKISQLWLEKIVFMINNMSNIKNYFIDFINFILIWIIMVFLVAIVFLGSRIEVLSSLFKSFIPLAFFFLIFLLIWKVERNKLNKLRHENATDLTLYLDYRYKFIDKMIVFSLPVFLILIAVIRGGVEVYDIVQALFILLVLSFWHRIMFKKI